VKNPLLPIPGKTRRWAGLFCCALVGLWIGSAHAEVTTIEIMHYFGVKDQLDALNALKAEFE